jgi:hypothetical protein
MSDAENRAAVLRKKSAVRDLMQEAFDRIDDPKNSRKGGMQDETLGEAWDFFMEEVVEAYDAFLNKTGNAAMEMGDVMVRGAELHRRAKEIEK